jgi:hypothetical protein
LQDTQEFLLWKNQRYLPIVIVVPPSLIYQWYFEIYKATEYFDVKVYYGDARAHKDKSVLISELTKNDKHFDGNSERAKTIIITSYQTLNARHGRRAQAKWQKKSHRELTGRQLDPMWPGNLENCFRVMVLDEAHMLRNLDTQTSQCLRWYRGNFNILLTATPTFNTINDFLGIAPFILNPLRECPDVPDGFHPLKPTADNLEVIFTISGLRRHVFQNKDLPGISKGQALLPIWKRCVIRRTLQSCIPFHSGNQIGDTIPVAISKTVKVQFSEFEKLTYDRQAEPILEKLYVRSRKQESAEAGDGTQRRKLIIRSDKLRLLIMLQTWIPLALIQHSLHATKSPQLDGQLQTNRLAKVLVRKILKVNWEVQYNRYLLATRQAELNATVEAFPKESQATPCASTQVAPTQPVHVEPPEPVPSQADLNNHTILIYLLVGSPKMRKMLAIIRDQVFRFREKSIVWCANPAQQFYVAATLKMAYIDAQVFHAGLGPEERAKLTKTFTSNPNELQVLVNSYYVNSAGSNLQGLCRNVHLFDVPSSFSILEQAIGRVRRLGQTRVVKVYDYRLEGSFNMQQIARNYEKSMPTLALFLSREEWDIQVNEDNEIEVGIWWKNADDSISRISEAIYATMPLYYRRQTLSTEDVFRTIIEHYQSGQYLQIRPNSDYEQIAENEGDLPDAPVDSEIQQTTADDL